MCSLPFPGTPYCPGGSAPPRVERSPLRPLSALSRGVAPGATEGSFQPSGRGGGRGTRGGARRALQPAEGQEVGFGEGGTSSWRRWRRRERSLRQAEPGGAGRAPRALSGPLLSQQRRLELAPGLLPSTPFLCAAPPPHQVLLPAVVTLPFSLLGTFLSNHPAGQTLMENFTPRWKNAGYERITGAPEHLPGHHRHPF